MTFSYTDAQVQQINALFTSGDYPGAYRLAADLAEGGEGVDPACIVWLRGAADVNEGVGSYSDFIRDYTEQQYIARHGDNTDFDAVSEIQAASNKIADNVLRQIIGEKAVPTIAQIAEKDAQPAAEDIFGGDPGGWAGNPLFLFLGLYKPFEDNIIETDGDTYDALTMIKFLGNTGDWITNIANACNAIAGSSLLNTATVVQGAIATDNFLAEAYGGAFTSLQIAASNIVLGRIIENDTLSGGKTGDAMHGGGGDDVLLSSDGNDILDGGAGVDAADFSAVEDSINVTVKLVEDSNAGFVASVNGAGLDSLYHIEKIIGTTGDDHFLVQSIPQTETTLLLDGSSGDGDQLSGFYLDGVEFNTISGELKSGGATVAFKGFERYEGSNGNDVFIFDGGEFEIDGRGGTDTLDLTLATQGVEVNGTTDPGINSIEIYLGSSFNDSITGSAGNDTITGGQGADKLSGGAGSDKYVISGDDSILDPEYADRVGFDEGDGDIIWLHGGIKGGGEEEDTGDGRDEYSRSEDFYYEETEAGTVVYDWDEDSNRLTLTLPDGSIVTVSDWDNDKAGIHLSDDGKFKNTGGLTSPLVLDLDGDGIELIETNSSGAYFDLDNDGFAERTGWVAPDDGLLALDLNSNGTIDNISELFGVEGNWDYQQLNEALLANKLPSGFDKLRLLDGNSDGVIDSADTVFDDLKVWQDANGDGVSQAGELHSLTSLGIASLSLTSTQEVVDNGTNAMTDFGSFTRTDSSTGEMVDVWFGYSSYLTKDLTPTTIDPDTANLPKLHGYGEAGSLSEAMSADAQLLSMVTDFNNLTVAGAAELESRVEDILLRWYGADTVNPLSRGENIDARWIAGLEHIFGVPWRNAADSPIPNANQGAFLTEHWRDYKSTILTQLLAQTPLGQTLFPGLAFSGMAFLTLPDTFSLDDALGNLSANAPSGGIEKLQYWHSMILVLDALYPEFKELLPPPGEEEEPVDFEPIFIGAIETALAADGITYSYQQLRGGNLGTEGDDFLLGVGSTFTHEQMELAYEALLVGGDGNDTYRVGSASWGSGLDIVVEGADAGIDTVESWETYTLTANVENLTLLGTAAINGTGNDLENMIVGNTNNNVLTGLEGADTLLGGAGNDTLQGGDGADSIDVGTGKDRVSFANVLEAGDIVTGFTTSGTEQDTINLDALFDALNGGISSAARASRVQLVETGTDVELRIDTAAGTGAGDGVGDVTLMVFAGMTSAAGLSVGTLSTSDIQVGTV